MAQQGIKLYPPELAALDQLISDARAVYGDKATRADVIGAMAHGVSVHQLTGMLAEFQRHDEWNADPPGEDQPESVSPPELHG